MPELPKTAPSKLVARPQTFGSSLPNLPAFDDPIKTKSYQSGWGDVWLNCGAQIAVAALTVSIPLVLKLASRGPANRSSQASGAVQRGNRGSSNLGHVSLERIDSEQRHKNELRNLWRDLPLVENPSGEYAPPAEKWLQEAADLYDSIKGCQRITKEAIRDATNTVATVMVASNDHREVLLPAASKQRFIDFLRAAGQDPEFKKFLTAPKTSRFQSYPSLPDAWPRLALEALRRELMEVQRLREVHSRVIESAAAGSWWNALGRDKLPSF
jgi:hypothetical protein